MTTPEEEKDLAILHADQHTEYERFSSYVRHLSEMDETMLRHCGYKTISEALIGATSDHKKKLNAIVQRHIKKYPD